MPKCINCGAEASHWHHVVPKSLGGREGTNKVPLCDRCHGLIHSVSYSSGQMSHSQLTKIGMEKAKKEGKQIGLAKGTKLTTKKSILAKEIIRKYNRDFEGELTDKETIEKANINRKTFYKYKKELRMEGL